MADKSIFDLTTQATFANDDRLVIGNYANNDARAITGADMVAQLTALANGHGGIASITSVDSSLDGGTNVITVTMADGTTASFNVKNGSKGSTGAQTYLYIKYAHIQPTQNSDMGSTPDEWIGMATTTSSSAPASYTSYTWYKFKGDTGATGAAASISTQTVEYQAGASGTSAPSGAWTTTVPTVAQGSYLWTRTTLAFNDGTNVVSYSVGRMGIDGSGTGTVQSVSYNGTVYNNVDANGNLALTDIQPKHSTVSVTIASTDWSSYTCTKTVSGVTASNTIIVSPAAASFVDYGDAQVRATAQGTNQVTFTCTDEPSSSLTVNVAIFG